jgi:hypothetical protein
MAVLSLATRIEKRKIKVTHEKLWNAISTTLPVMIITGSGYRLRMFF